MSKKSKPKNKPKKQKHIKKSIQIFPGELLRASARQQFGNIKTQPFNEIFKGKKNKKNKNSS